MSDDVSRALEVLADVIADRVAARLLGDQRPGWMDQASSPLGRRRHCSAVRLRVAAGLSGAAVVGRRHLLSSEALAEELATGGRGKRPDRSRGVAAELRTELALVAGGRR